MSNLSKKASLIFSKIHFPRRRFNSFHGNNSLTEFILALFSLFLPPFFFKKALYLFQQNFSQFSGCAYNYSYAQGRMALYHGLLALEFNPGDEILIPAFTCVVVPNAILYANLKPIYVDIEDTYFNFDLSDLSKKITPKTKAIYIQYTFGHIGKIEELLQFAHQHKLKVIEDCAHTLGQKIQIKNGKGENETRHLGTLGNFSFCSTDHSKIISTQIGGMLSTNDPSLAKRIENLLTKTPPMPWPLETRVLLNFILEFTFLNSYTYWLGELLFIFFRKIHLLFHLENELITDFSQLIRSQHYPMRLGPRLSMLGICQLKKLDENLQNRIRNVQNFKSYFPLKSAEYHLPLLRYSFIVQDQKHFAKMVNPKINLGIWFTSIFQGRDQDLEKLNYKMGSCPQAEYCAQHIVNFPTHMAVNSQSLIDFFKRNQIEV